jgi:hypothetical protein
VLHPLYLNAIPITRSECRSEGSVALLAWGGRLLLPGIEHGLSVATTVDLLSKCIHTFVESLVGRTPLDRFDSRWEDNIKMDYKII